MRVAAIVAVLSLTSLSAQVEWVRMPPSSPGVEGKLVYDRSGGRVLLVAPNRPGENTGYIDVWELDGNDDWQLLETSPTPIQNFDKFAVCFDDARGRLVLFGHSKFPSETWEWDGQNWTLVTTGTPPTSPNIGHMTFDAARQRSVLQFEGTTWEWDGVAWLQRAASPLLFMAGMAYDLGRGRVVAVDRTGGTWEWDGTSWQAMAPTQAPPSRFHTTMTYDAVSQAVVLFGGQVGLSTRLDDFWQWDGLDWTEVVPTNRPPTSLRPTMVFDEVAGELVLVRDAELAVWRGDQADWRQIPQTVEGPSIRFDHAMVYEPLRDVVLMFGGATGYTGPAGRRVLAGKNDTWEFDGVTWIEQQPANRPPVRAGHGMVYDPDRQRVVVYGGRGASGTTTLADTWEWDGLDWQQVVPVNAPGPRQRHGMAFDPIRRTVLLFGGVDDLDVHSDETWEWDGSDWNQLFPLTSPVPRANAVMTTDNRRGRIVLFGGFGGPLPTFLQDTWEWDGTAWIDRTKEVFPTTGVELMISYDADRDRSVLYQTDMNATRERYDPWEWDGNSWRKRVSSLSPTCFLEGAMAYHEGTSRMVAFGAPLGFSTQCCFFPFASKTPETWLYGGTQLASFGTFGAGCPGAAGSPQLAATEFGLPYLESSLEVELSSLAPAAPAFLFVGGSSTVWGAVPLPLPLGSFGMGSCSLLISPDLAVPVVNVGGMASWSLPICDCPEFVGASIFMQGGALDATANPAGVVWSQGGVAVIGAR